MSRTTTFDPGSVIGAAKFKLPFNDDQFDPETPIVIRCAYCDWEIETTVSKRRGVYVEHRKTCGEVR